MSRVIFGKLHDRLRAQLEDKGLSAAQAARSAGEEDSQGLRDVLSGRKRLSAELLGALVRGTGIDGGYVLTGERSRGVAEVELLPADERVLIDNYRRCNADAKRNLIQTSALLSAGMAPAPSKRPAPAPATTQSGGIQQHNTGTHVVQIGTYGGSPRTRSRPPKG